MAPALFADTAPSMRINREEIFGPVASVVRVKDYDEALAVAIDTNFPGEDGRTSGVPDSSELVTLRFAEPLSHYAPRR